MATIYRDNDVDMKILDGRRIGVVGYGNQGRAPALKNSSQTGFMPDLERLRGYIQLDS